MASPVTIIEYPFDPTALNNSMAMTLERGTFWRNTLTGDLFLCVDPGAGQWIRLFTEKRNGVVAPAYDPNELVTYNYGPTWAGGAASTTAPTGDDYNALETAAGIGSNVNGAMYGMAMHWDVLPGQKTITEFTVASAFLQSTHIQSWAIDIWRDDNSRFSLIASTGLITADAGSTGSIVMTKVLTTPLVVTLESGKKYYLSFRVKRTAAVATTPYLSRSLTGTFAQDSFAFVTSPTGLDGNTLAKVNVSGTSAISTANSEKIPRLQITYNSPNYVEQEIVPVNPIDKTFLTVNADSHPYLVKLEGLAVGDTKSLVVEIRDLTGAATENLLESLELDCGNTVALQNDMIFNAKTVNLPAIGGQSQAGDTMDLIFGWRHYTAGTKKYDLYWQNRYQDDGFHSHAVKFAGARATLYLYGSATYEPRLIRFTGAYNSLSKIVVGVKPMVLIGDSQTISGSGVDVLRYPNTSRLGALPTALTKKRMHILHGQAGKYLSGTSGVEATLFRSATVGAGDGVELLGLGCDWVFSGIGVNDVSVATKADDADAAKIVATLTKAIASIAEYILDAGETIHILGLPPYSSDANADQYEGKAVRWWNRALLGLALAWRVPFHNPWPDMVEKGTEDDLLPEFLETYTGDSGTHYNATGAAIAVAGMKAAIENATIDMRDAWN